MAAFRLLPVLSKFTLALEKKSQTKEQE